MNATHDSLLSAYQSREIGNLKAAWAPTRREAPLGNWMADALRGGTKADIALVPASWIQKGFPKGRVRVEDVWNAIPPGLNMVSVFTLPGSDVMKYLERQMRHSKEYIFLSGLSCTPDSSMFGGNPIAAVVGGKPLDKSAYYRIAIPKQLRNDIYELTGISESSAGAEWDRHLGKRHDHRVGADQRTFDADGPPSPGDVLRDSSQVAVAPADRADPASSILRRDGGSPVSLTFPHREAFPLHPRRNLS